MWPMLCSHRVHDAQRPYTVLREKGLSYVSGYMRERGHVVGPTPVKNDEMLLQQLC